MLLELLHDLSPLLTSVWNLAIVHQTMVEPVDHFVIISGRGNVRTEVSLSQGCQQYDFLLLVPSPYAVK